MTVLKYESDLKWSSKSLTVDDVLDELSLVAIVQLNWNARENVISSKVVSLSFL